MLREMRECNPETDERRLAAFAERHGIELPAAYREFLLRHNGGRPVPKCFPIEGFANNPYDGIQAFFGLGASIRAEDLDEVMSGLVSLIPAGILPIACTDGDDFVCLDLRRGEGRVVYWDRRPFWGENVWREAGLYPVSTSFEALQADLCDDPDNAP